VDAANGVPRPPKAGAAGFPEGSLLKTTGPRRRVRRLLKVVGFAAPAFAGRGMAFA